MHLHGGGPRAVEVGGQGVGIRVGPPLDPYLADRVAAVGRKEADAVAGRHDGVEVFGQGGYGQVEEDILPHLEGRLQLQRQLGNHAEGPKAHHHGGEVRVIAVQGHQLAVGLHQVEREDRGGQVAVGDARAVGTGGAGPRHGDVRQAGQVVHREAALVQLHAEVAVAGPGADGQQRLHLIDTDDAVELAGTELGVGAVGDVVEAVPGAEGLARFAAAHERLQFPDGFRFVEFLGAVDVVARPVGAGGGGGAFGCDGGRFSVAAELGKDEPPGRGGRGQFEKGGTFHGVYLLIDATT